MDFDVTIEIPKGGRNKYEVDHHSGRIRLDRTLFTATQYPADYGFIDDTLGEDGDPLDALVLVRADVPRLPDPLPRDRHVPDDGREGRRRQGALRARDDPRQEHLRDIHDLPEFDRLEIQHFFEVYKDLEPGKSVEGAIWVGRADAEREIKASCQRAKDEQAVEQAEEARRAGARGVALVRDAPKATFGTSGRTIPESGSQERDGLVRALWLSKLSVKRVSSRTKACRSSSGQPLMRLAIPRLRSCRFSSNTRLPSSVATSRVARPSAGSATRSTSPSCTRCATCLLTVEGSECTASASAPARRAPSFTRCTSSR